MAQPKIKCKTCGKEVSDKEASVMAMLKVEDCIDCRKKKEVHAPVVLPHRHMGSYKSGRPKSKYD